MTRHRFVFLLVLVAASRFPFLWNGYGGDADAWRVAETAHRLAETGTYAVSRFPGYPLYEFLSAPLVLLGGAPLSNALSLTAMLALMIAARPAAERRARHPDLLLVALAFAPLLWKNSTLTMDYLPSLLFLFLAAERVTAGHPVAAGIFAGIAGGFRPANIVAVLPFALVLLVLRAPRRQLTAFLAASAATMILAFLPVVITCGIPGWIRDTVAASDEITFTSGERLLLFGYRTMTSVGPLAWFAAGIVAWTGRRTYAAVVAEREPWTLLCAFTLLTFLLLYLWFPLEREYLIPMVPPLLFLVDRGASRHMMVAFTVLLISFAAVNPDVVRHGGIRGTPGFNIRWGLLPEEVDRRNAIASLRAGLAGLRLTGPSVVMTGTGPAMWVENPLLEHDPDPLWPFLRAVVVQSTANRNVHYVEALTPSQRDAVRSAGYSLYCYSPAAAYLELKTGYRMADEHIPLIPAP